MKIREKSYKFIYYMAESVFAERLVNSCGP